MRTRHVTSALACAVAGALLVSSCSSGSSGGDDGGPVTLNLLTHYANDPLKSGLQEMVDEWNEANPDVQVKTQAVAFEDLLKTITVQQTGGRSADIIQAYGLWAGQLDKANVLADVPDDVAATIESEFSPAAVGAASVDGELVGFPTEVQTYGLFYNKDLLAEAGYDEPPATWDEIRDAAGKITERDGSGNVVRSGFGISQGWDSIAVHPWQSLMNAAGGQFLADDGSVAFDSAEGVDALQLERDLVDDGSADTSMDVLKAFPSQQIGMTINAGWWIGSLKSTMGDDYSSIGVAPIPGPEEGQKGSLAYGYFMGVNQASKHQEAAWEFLTWLNAEEGDNGASRMSTFQFSQGTIPARTADVEVLAADADPNMQVFVDALTYAEPEANPAAGQEIKTELQRQIESVWVGESTPEAALESAASFADGKLGS